MASNKIEYLSTDKNLLEHQLGYSHSVRGKAQEFIRQYCITNNIVSLDDISLDDVLKFRLKTLNRDDVPNRVYYASLMESVILEFKQDEYTLIKSQIGELNENRAIKNKMMTFLIIVGIKDAMDIDIYIRDIYVDFIISTIAESKQREYIKALDKLKLNDIKKKHNATILKEYSLKYRSEKIFLQYHPNYDIAYSFYYMQDKEELVFDFSVACSALIKRQIFKMLDNVLKTNTNIKDRRERFLVPLKLLYKYCIVYGIGDLEQLTRNQVAQFREFIIDNSEADSKTDIYMQIVDNIRKYLFLSAKEINWNANVWYLERFQLDSTRVNPARPIQKFLFDDVKIAKNNELFKLFMRYQIGVSVKMTMQTLRGIYYDILDFLYYLDKKNFVIQKVSREDMLEYINMLEHKDIEADTYNRAVISIARFYNYLLTKNKVDSIPFYFGYYLKKTLPYHYDRSVSDAQKDEILEVLDQFPYHLRLMFLHLYCVGLRESEVCVIKGNAYSYDGQDAWVKIYQNKMKTEKRIPIPKVLYDLMDQYIKQKGIATDEYIFKNRHGGAYDANTFSKQVKEYLKKAGVVDYNFKSHDFRHTVATDMYDSGVSLATLRDYLDHKEVDMTKKYIDYMNLIVDEQNKKYLSKKNNALIKLDGEDG